MLKFFLFIHCFLCLCALSATAQITEHFTDGDFTNDPVWSGDIADFTVNPSLQLQSNNTLPNSTFYLSTANAKATSAQWEIFVQLGFNTSSANYIDVYLTASAADLSNSSTTGYFIRIGNTDDEISLYRKNAGGATVKIIDGVDDILNTSGSVMKIKVIRSATNQFTLLRDLSGTGTNYFTEGFATDTTYKTSLFFGYLVKQSTASFFQKHFFDNIEVGDFIPDVIPPSIQEINVTSANSLDVLFSEAIDNTTAGVLINYTADNSIGNPATAVQDAVNLALVHLTFATNFPNGTSNTLTINNVKDFSGNTLSGGTGAFSFYTPQPFDVVIDEIFADPTPVVSLPAAEFIEIKNTSGKSINLQGWTVNSLSTGSAAFPSYILPSDSFLILTGTANEMLFATYGRVLGISSFPALDNTGTAIWLTSKEGLVIHTVNYNVDWFQNDVKSDGGWTLEMIDTDNPCSGANNWKASANLSGGTPGSTNSINGLNPDEIAPALIRAAALDSVTILLTFSEPVSLSGGGSLLNYAISEGINTPLSAVVISPTFNQVELKLSFPVVTGKIYIVTAINISDCSGNVIQAINTARVGLPAIIDSSDLIINEVLFNPKPNTVDYVEIYNRSNKVFDLQDMYIANRSSATNTLGSLQQLSSEHILVFPGDFFVISENGAIVKQNYLVKNPDNFIDVTMPSLPDDEVQLLC